MKKILIVVVLACTLSAAAGAAATKRLIAARPGDQVTMRTAALNCRVGYAQVTCTDPRRRSRHLSIKVTRTEVIVTRPLTRKRTRVLLRYVR